MLGFPLLFQLYALFLTVPYYSKNYASIMCTSLVTALQSKTMGYTCTCHPIIQILHNGEAEKLKRSLGNLKQPYLQYYSADFYGTKTKWYYKASPITACSKQVEKTIYNYKHGDLAIFDTPGADTNSGCHRRS